MMEWVTKPAYTKEEQFWHNLQRQSFYILGVPVHLFCVMV